MRKLIFLLTFGAIFACSGTALADTFNTPGTYTYTVPAGVTSVLFQTYGAGGAGGPQQFFSGNGGGAGGAFASDQVSTTPGSTFTITVGQGGASASAAGGDSSVTGNGVVIAAKGGAGGSSGITALGGQASASTGSVKFSGGNGGTDTGSGTIGGGGGGGAGTLANGSPGAPRGFTGSPGGAGGAVGGGNGGSGNGNSSSSPGSTYGGGGAGAGGTGVFAEGANGGVVVIVAASVCTSCPAYVEYTGPGTLAADRAGAQSLATPASQVFFDAGDVFKLNAAKTGYDYVDGFTLQTNVGWCGYDPKNGKNGYWCGVVPVQTMPATINSFKQAEADPPSCTLSNANIVSASNKLGGQIAAIVSMKCNERLPAIFTWTQLVKLQKIGGFPGTTRANNAQSWVNTDNPQPPPGVFYTCDASTWVTKGTVTYKVYIDVVLVGTDGHTYDPTQYGSGEFTFLATKKSPVCA